VVDLVLIVDEFSAVVVLYGGGLVERCVRNDCVVVFLEVQDLAHSGRG